MAKLHFSLTFKDFPRNESYKVFPFNCPFLLHSPNLPYDFDLKHFGIAIIEESIILNPTSLLFDFNTKPSITKILSFFKQYFKGHKKSNLMMTYKLS